MIIRVGNEFRPNDFIGNVFRHHAAIAGSPGAERVDVADSVYLARWKSSAFCNPELSQVLKDGHVEQVSPAGLFREPA